MGAFVQSKLGSQEGIDLAHIAPVMNLSDDLGPDRQCKANLPDSALNCAEHDKKPNVRVGSTPAVCRASSERPLSHP